MGEGTGRQRTSGAERRIAAECGWATRVSRAGGRLELDGADVRSAVGLVLFRVLRVLRHILSVAAGLYRGEALLGKHGPRYGSGETVGSAEGDRSRDRRGEVGLQNVPAVVGRDDVHFGRPDFRGR